MEAEGSENNRAQERGHRKAKAKEKVGESSLMRPFHFKKCTVVACGAAKSLGGAEPAATFAEACEKCGRRAGDDRKVEAVEQKSHFRGRGEQVITSFVRLQVSGALGGHDARYAPHITDCSTPPLVGNDQLLLLAGDPVEMTQGQVGDDVKPCVGGDG